LAENFKTFLLYEGLPRKEGFAGAHDVLSVVFSEAFLVSVLLSVDVSPFGFEEVAVFLDLLA
jgi:hypothetical protein